MIFDLSLTWYSGFDSKLLVKPTVLVVGFSIWLFFLLWPVPTTSFNLRFEWFATHISPDCCL